MATNDDPTTEFRTALEIRNSDADAVRFCPDCGLWASHEMQDDGSYVCENDHQGGSQ